MKILNIKIATFLFILLCFQNSFSGTSQQSFKPTSYKYPIMQIDISKTDGSGSQTLYKCSGATPTDCLVDMADATSLATIEAAAQNVAIAAGDYTKLKLSNCPAGSSGTTTTTIQVTGSVLVGSTTYTTSSTAAGGMQTGGTPQATSITWGCGGASVTLSTPISVTAGSSQSLSLIVDLTNAVWTDANASAGMGGCKSDSGALQDICGAVPLIVPYFGSGTPTYERYLVSHSTSGSPVQANANAQVNFAVDPNGAVFWVGVQPYFSPTSTTTGPDYNTSTRTLATNSDNTISFQTGGSSDDNRVGFTAFQRATTHTGTCKNELTSSATFNYTAYKQ